MYYFINSLHILLTILIQMYEQTGATYLTDFKSQKKKGNGIYEILAKQIWKIIYNFFKEE